MIFSAERIDKQEPLPVPQNRVVHLGIIVGHTKKAPGAVSNTGMTEYDYNNKVASLIKKLSNEIPQIRVSVFYRDIIGIAGAYDLAEENKCDAVIELHFNAFNKKATGTVTLCTTDQQDIEFSNIIHTQMCTVFKRSGSSQASAIGRSNRGAQNVYSFPGGVNCIVEPFFGDSEGELGEELMDEYARCLLEGVFTWAVIKRLVD